MENEHVSVEKLEQNTAGEAIVSDSPQEHIAPAAKLAWGSEAPPMSRMKKVVTIFILSLALAIIIIDTTLLNVSLATIIRDFHTDIQSLQWVITAYSLTLAALTITGGRLGDFFGRKKMFVVGAIIFAIGSFISSISNNVGTMIWGESIIEGIGAALMMPATASILVSNFRGRERALAFGVWGGVAGAASAIGPILGGFLTTYYSWRWGFRINIFIVALLCVGAFFLPETKVSDEKPEFDWLGLFLSATGLTSFIFGVIESSTYGWWKAKVEFVVGTHSFASFFGSLSPVPYALALGIALLTLFVAWEMHREEKGHTPLVSMSLFKNRQFIVGVLTTGIVTLGMSGLFFSIPVFLQGVLHYDALKTGISFLPMSITLLLVSPLTAHFSGKIKPRYLIMAGAAIQAIAFLALRQGIRIDGTSAGLIPGFILFGLGMGMIMSQVNNITLSAVPQQQAGEASGVNNTFRQVGSSFGSAIIGAALLSLLTTNLTSGVSSSSVIPQDAKSQITTAVTRQTSSIEFGNGAQLGSHVPQPITEEITTIVHNATVDASRASLLIGAAFALLALVIAFFLPNIASPSDREHKPSAGH